MVIFNPKTKNLYKRDEKFRLTNRVSDDRYKMIDKWYITQKMDGMSVILSRSPDKTTYYGRSNSTNFNAEQQEFMQGELDNMVSLLDHHADIYAELVGPGVQGNPYGLTELKLFAFDVMVNGYWLDWNNVTDVCNSVGIQTVPSYGWMDLERVYSLLDYMRDWPDYYEGVVARTDPWLYDNQGERIRWKLKLKDLT